MLNEQLRQLIREAVLNAYEILGVPRNADDATINQAYRKLAIANHPDRGGDHAKMVSINVAKDVLTDPVKRMRLDAQLGTQSTSSVSRSTGPESMDDFWKRQRSTAGSPFDSKRSRNERERAKERRDNVRDRARNDRSRSNSSVGSEPYNAYMAGNESGEATYEFIGGNSKKWWKISWKIDTNATDRPLGSFGQLYVVTVKFGRIGSLGHGDSKDFYTERAANKFITGKVSEKLAKGYVRVPNERHGNASAGPVGGQPNRPPKDTTSSTSGQERTASSSSDKQRRVYGKRGPFTVHTRVDGKVYGNKYASEFNNGEKANTRRTPDGKLHVSKDGHTQTWDPEE